MDLTFMDFSCAEWQECNGSLVRTLGFLNFSDGSYFGHYQLPSYSRIDQKGSLSTWHKERYDLAGKALARA